MTALSPPNRDSKILDPFQACEELAGAGLVAGGEELLAAGIGNNLGSGSIDTGNEKGTCIAAAEIEGVRGAIDEGL